LAGAGRKRLTSMNEIARVIALPHENAPIRFPTYPNLARTATVSLEYNATTESSSYGSHYRRYVLTRDAGCPLWYDIKSSLVGSSTPPSLGYVTNVVEPASPNLGRPYQEIYASSGNSPLGILDGEEARFMYAPAEQISPTSVGPCTYAVLTNVGTTLILSLKFYQPNGQTVIHDVTVAGTTPVALPFGGGFFEVVHAHTVTTGPLVRIIFYVPADKKILMPAFRPLEADVSHAPYDDCRVNASSLLLTNVSRVQVKQGTVLGARLQRNDVKPWSWGRDDLSLVHPSERFFSSCEYGVYTFTSPGQADSTFRHAVAFTRSMTNLDPTAMTYGDTLARPVVQIGDDEYFNAVYIEEESSVDETVLAVTCDLHIEFRTTSSLFTIGISALPLETYHAALLAVNTTGFFFENSTHWASLAGLLLKGLNAALPIVAPELAGPARALGTAAVAGYRAGKALISSVRRKPISMPQKQMVLPTRGRAPRRRRTQKPRVKRN